MKFMIQFPGKFYPIPWPGHARASDGIECFYVHFLWFGVYAVSNGLWAAMGRSIHDTVKRSRKAEGRQGRK